jgi:hypothetical protein
MDLFHAAKAVVRYRMGRQPALQYYQRLVSALSAIGGRLASLNDSGKRRKARQSRSYSQQIMDRNYERR